MKLLKNGSWKESIDFNAKEIWKGGFILWDEGAEVVGSEQESEYRFEGGEGKGMDSFKVLIKMGDIADKMGLSWIL